MKNKQIIGIVVTGVVIIAVGVSGVLSNVVSSKLLSKTKTANEKSTGAMMEEIFDMSSDKEISLPDDKYVGVINIVGEIGPSSTETNIFATDTNEYDHDRYMKYIDQMIEDDNNKGIMLYVDSPGGTVYESDELYLKLMEYKEKTKRPIWSYFASQACSGGYYIAMASDKIYANRNCWTGSIGVIISLLNTKGLYDKLGIEEIDITSGPNKAMGSSGLEMTKEQREILQSMVDEAYEQFTDIVSTGRGMDINTVKKIADGRIYTAQQAVENGLVDEIGSYEEEKKAFCEANDLEEGTEFFTPASNENFFSALTGKIAEIRPKSDTEIAVEIENQRGKGVLMYYAD